MNILFIKIILAISIGSNLGCVSDASFRDNNQVLAEPLLLPLPITQRYPAIEQNYLFENELLDDIEYFTCSDTVQSTLTDNVPLIDVSFIEADVNDALLELSLLTGISIITDDSIEGFVSINFSGISLDEVLTAIIAPGNYGYKKYDSFIFVGSQSPVSPSFHLLSNTCLYKPVYLQPLQIVELITPYYQQYINFIEGHDYLSIVAPDSIQERIQNDIFILDQSPEQVLLEMSIIEISTEALDLLGVNWNQEVQVEALTEQRSNHQVFRYFDPTEVSSSIAQVLINSVSALSLREQAQIKATPSIVTLNGREANFSSIQTSWIETFSNGANSQREVSYGVEMRIIPYISPNNHIRLEIIQASVSDLTQDSDLKPRLISHSISTSVLMLDGETLILGGLLQKKTINQDRRVPGAASIPVFGGMFRHSDKEVINTEVLIVIRPRILRG